ncbi:7-carboxy-7-deazaguanine synthase QueE [Amycolatopsis sp. CA-126428]|uniref:7-carboxy-7-deazaguanine synthase QueE n=1 Tax=Amycolatopsis sp. CA-126428 TaxID=2073158 RepID=UPI001E489682|nr:7-carboxy-7-deazaguanine synthase QueE [Amycolatopsis sp. CA-126428]
MASEVFGPTAQGEGPSAGRRASFIRLGGCNLACGWCDTAYTWDSTRFDLRAELSRKPVAEIVDRALAGDPALVVISGGEPLLHQHQPGWTRLLRDLRRAGVNIEIETNGTVSPTAATLEPDLGVRFNVSPKLAHSGDPYERRIQPDVLAALDRCGRTVFKFVCATPADVDEAAELVTRHELVRPVWISPEGTSVEAIAAHTRLIADRVIEHGFNLGSRVHVLAWGNERGR